MPDILENTSRLVPALSATSDAPVIEPEPAAEPIASDPKLGDALADADVQLPDQSPAPLADQEPKPESGSTAEKPPKEISKFNLRIGDLTRERDEALRVAEELADANRRLRLQQQQPPQQQAQAEPPPQQPVQQELPRPKRVDFTDPDAYEDALAAYYDARADLRYEQRVTRDREEQTRQAEQQRVNDANAHFVNDLSAKWNAVQERGTQKHTDFVEKVNTVNFPMTVPMLNALANSENGEDVVYHLADNPEEAARIANMVVPGQFLQNLPPLADGSPNPLNGQPLPDFPKQTFAMGQLAARLAAAANQPPPVSRAPAPITPVRSGNGATVRTLADVGSEEGQGMEEYARMRNEGISAERAGRAQPKYGRA